MACEHKNFHCAAHIGRLSDEEGGPITGYVADLKIECADCGLPFRFVGLNAGNHHSEPRVSIDGIELRAPIEPAEHEKFAPRAEYTPRPSAKH
ncbi:hypothetical protein PUV54_16580 [Hyphococcus flavus]|uniref:Uncharacterized protein n=1 Tax=Hyphococcus flavus TaxID=1866326 RepID=A0AAE9ZBD7_9PROT|nr:hypothetical protein [Hyphococcus flavus]WDI31569.1 hypothetical protein PUV54_16580 [Hyphococcus flavus]